MRKLACLASLAFAVTFAAACSSRSDDPNATSTDALSTLTVAQCKMPVVHTSPKADGSGDLIAGSAHTTLAGCIVGSQGETGESVVTRLTNLLADTSRLATVQDPQGNAVFSQFTPATRHATLAAGVTQDINVTLAMDHSPYTTLHTVQKRAPGASYSMSIVNSTAVDASVAFFTVTVVEPGDLALSLEVKAAANGITITGTSDIILQQEQDQAAQASVLVTDIFHWLATELAKSAPPAVPVPVPVADAGTHDAGHSSDGGAPPNDGGSSEGGASSSDAAASNGDASAGSDGGSPD